MGTPVSAAYFCNIWEFVLICVSRCEKREQEIDKSADLGLKLAAELSVRSSSLLCFLPLRFLESIFSEPSEPTARQPHSVLRRLGKLSDDRQPAWLPEHVLGTICQILRSEIILNIFMSIVKAIFSYN